jgi:hypothetical protein
MTTTTLRRLKEANACVSRYLHLRESLGKEFGLDTKISLQRILETNGLEDTLWALSNVVDGGDKILRLWAADCAEHVLHFFTEKYPNDKRPAEAIQAARDFANGKITKAARDAARAAAWAAARAAAADAAWDAASAAADAAASAAWAAASAARSAASAARSAAWVAASAAEAASAARDAAWSAAEAASAARDAAWAAAADAASAAASAAADAAWAAETKWQTDYLLQYLNGEL